MTVYAVADEAACLPETQKFIGQASMTYPIPKRVIDARLSYPIPDTLRDRGDVYAPYKAVASFGSYEAARVIYRLVEAVPEPDTDW